MQKSLIRSKKSPFTHIARNIPFRSEPIVSNNFICFGYHISDLGQFPLSFAALLFFSTIGFGSSEHLFVIEWKIGIIVLISTLHNGHSHLL
jgi:hypothetical protein